VFEIPNNEKINYQVIRRALIQEDKEDKENQEKGEISLNTLHSPNSPHISYTIEFYPEEGKYHWTGHRLCNVKQSPQQTKKLGTVCPVCGRKLTVGVMHRVDELATRPADFKSENRPPYKMLVPLMEILAEVKNSTVSSQIVESEYNRTTTEFGSEFNLLLKTPIEEIAKIGGEKLAEGVKKVREGDIFVDPGYDGVFGIVKIWGEEKKVEEQTQMELF
jgi:PHP family Zn ribbon phosphoesterase